jgi:hypothetical protein
MPKYNFENPTPQEIADHYKAAMGSVYIIKGSRPVGMDNETYADLIRRNKEHLKIMLAKPWWTTEDLQPLRDSAA